MATGAFTIADYESVFEGRRDGHVLVNHEDMLIWTATRPSDVRQAHHSVAVSWPTLMQHKARSGAAFVLAAPEPWA